MNGTALLIQPLLPLWAIAVLGLLALLVVAYGIWRRARGVLLRAALFALLLLALLDPALHREERRPLPDTVLLVADRSPSQKLEPRPQQTDEALALLRERLARLPGVTVEEATVVGDGREGTPLFTTLRRALEGIDSDRLAAVIAVTDGLVHDVGLAARLLPESVPFHALITGRPDERDRSLVVEAAPTFAVVGEPQELVVRVDDLPSPTGDPARLILRRDGEVIAQRSVVPGTSTRLPFTLDKGGASAFELEVEALPGEITTRNNRVALLVNGVRDRLRVLLISGLPHQGLRVWRNLLKADPSVDLVHFTILRPPEKQDGTPIHELALIAFPTRELFELKLAEFDLVIFDRYARRGLLPLVYLDNIARYVEEGGALLEAAGPEFASPDSLYRTPLARILPARPTGQVYERPYLPHPTAVGRRHPVTRGLATDPERPDWGRWLRLVDTEPARGEVLLQGFGERPLLVLDRVGRGRVAQLLSDQAWLWARGFEGGGPQSVLLRRLVHWLMREPELEEEALLARPVEGGIEIERRSLNPEPVTVEVTSPAGERRSLTLVPDADGIARHRLDATEEGLWRVSDGTRTTFAAPNPIAPRELERMVSTTEVLAPVAETTGGTVLRLATAGVPDLRLVAEGRRAFGRGWIGLRDRDRYIVTATERIPLFHPALSLAALLVLAGLAWWREGRS
ncbi:hypothetical protein HRbin40_00269 [bacterium HR40]|nr:hypothetical protein HRbin40_00269 [bacterium HR40]